MKNSNKVTKVDETILKPEMFENNKSYQYFLKGFKFIQEIQKLKDKGYIIFNKGEPIVDDFYLNFDSDGYMPRLGPCTNNGRCMIMWLGSTIGNIINTIYVYKKELEPFKHFSYVKPQDHKKIDFV